MKNITFKQQFTFNEQAVLGFAIFLGWSDVVQTSEVGENGLAVTRYIENPETYIDFVDRKAREHSLEFTKSWAEKLKKDYMNTKIEETRATLEPILYEQIVKPVEDALTSEVVNNTLEK